ncbi:MAG: hypothetical protein H6953_19045 [Chromatiaceae bacterium]|nr:hypothetical protein [Chromatiaceae bacterium]
MTEMMGQLLAEHYLALDRPDAAASIYRQLIAAFPGDSQVCEWQAKIVMSTLARDEPGVQWAALQELMATARALERSDAPARLRKTCRYQAADYLTAMAGDWHRRGVAEGDGALRRRAEEAYRSFAQAFPEDSRAAAMARDLEVLRRGEVPPGAAFCAGFGGARTGDIVAPKGNETEESVAPAEARGKNGDFIESTEASRRAVQYILGLARGGTLPNSIRQEPKCESACIDIDSLRRMNTCTIWNCQFSFRDPAVGVPSFGVEVVVDTAGRISSPIDIAACINSDHGCEVLLGYNAALRRLRADRMSLRIEWDQERHAFFWVNVDSGSRVSCHDRGDQRKRSSAD